MLSPLFCVPSMFDTMEVKVLYFNFQTPFEAGLRYNVAVSLTSCSRRSHEKTSNSRSSLVVHLLVR